MNVYKMAMARVDKRKVMKKLKAERQDIVQDRRIRAVIKLAQEASYAIKYCADENDEARETRFSAMSLGRGRRKKVGLRPQNIM